MIVKAIQCGISVSEFWRMSWREFMLHCIAYDQREINEYVKLRHICFTIVRMNGDPKKTPKIPQEFWRLPIDEKPEPISKEKIMEIAKKYSQSTSSLIGKA